MPLRMCRRRPGNEIVAIVVVFLAASAGRGHQLCVAFAWRASSSSSSSFPNIAGSPLTTTPTTTTTFLSDGGIYHHHHCRSNRFSKHNGLFVSSIRQSSSSAAGTSEEEADEGTNSFAVDSRYHHQPTTLRPLTLRPSLLIQKLRSFTTNISRGRKRKRGRVVDDALIDACNSLVHFLRDEIVLLLQSSSSSSDYYYHDEIEDINFNNLVNSTKVAQDMLNNALITSIRATSEVGDFILLQKLVVAAVDYIATINEYDILLHNREHAATDDDDTLKIIRPRLSPRIFGEAFVGMSKKTKASTSKLKSLWSYFANDVVNNNIARSSNNDINEAGTKDRKRGGGSSILSHSPTSHELNSILTALGHRGKVSAAIRIYKNVTIHDAYGWTSTMAASADDKEGGTMVLLRGDAYTASALFGMLAESISSSSSSHPLSSSLSLSNNDTSSVNDHHVERYISPCWQWNEAMSLLDTFDSNQLNNHAYAALLKVNERAVEEFSKPYHASKTTTTTTTTRMGHNGVRCAMLVLERMRNDNTSPDVVTCSILMNTFDKGRNWKAAITLLNAMRLQKQLLVSRDVVTATNEDISESKHWSMPLPNTYTYSMAISICARCHQGKLALSLLNEMEESALLSSSSSSSKTNQMVDDSVIVNPNTWVYNAALLACVQGSSSAMDEDDNDDEIMYFTPKSSKSKHGTNLAMAFNILEKMERSESRHGMDNDADCYPDVVTYNTLLSILDESTFLALKEDSPSEVNHRLMKHDRIVDVVFDILDTMEDRGIARDAVTYYNAIMACRGSHNSTAALDAVKIFSKAHSDPTFMSQINGSKQKVLESKTRQLKGRAASGVIFMANAALSVASKFGDIRTVSEVLSHLPHSNTKLNAQSIVHIIQTFGKVADGEAILALLICLRGQKFANDILKERYSIDVLSNMPDESIPMVEETIYSAAITSCLKHDALGAADQILLSMKKNGLTLNQRSLKDVISEYCRMAMTSSKEEFKIARLAKRHGIDDSRHGIIEPMYITSLARAKAALTMLRAVESPPPSLYSSVAKASCAAGLWQDARSILRRMHRKSIRELRSVPRSDNDFSVVRVKGGAFLDELPRLHRSLLKFCAKGGNITPALNFADDIQFLASQMRLHTKALRDGPVNIDEDERRPEWITVSSRLLMDAPTPDEIPEADFRDAGVLSANLDRPVGLTGQDWKLILIAASRGGHWKVCVGTLPFIRPYVKETHPMYARETLALSTTRDGNYSRPTLESLNRKHDRIARALTAAVLCFEARSQYAWALRAIDDWIEWSGRRPRKEAIASACRILAMRHRGQEVLSLVTKVLEITPTLDCSATNDDVDSDEVSEYTYEKAIYTESINALHKSGLYIEADQLYAEGVAAGHLPWAVIDGNDQSPQLRLDLHGMSAAVAHAAVRVSLQKESISSQSSSIKRAARRMRDVLIITGRGRRSGEKYRPVLRPEVQRMLTEEFYPPLGTSSIPGNMGALLVPSKDIDGWLDHQRKQKGERLLFVADILRDISSGNRLERALLRKFKSEEDTGLLEQEDAS